MLVDEGSDSMQATSAEKVVQLLSPTPVAISSEEARSLATRVAPGFPTFLPWRPAALAGYYLPTCLPTCLPTHLPTHHYQASPAALAGGALLLAAALYFATQSGSLPN